MNLKTRLGILVSGRGSNMEAIVQACQQNQIEAEVAVVISNQPGALAIGKAKKKGLLTVLVPNGPDLETKIAALLKEHRVELICLAGFMKILSPDFIRQFPNRILNIHPSLLPAFPGLNAQKQALDSGVQWTGVTVHLVDEGCDTGPILLQSVVPVEPQDTLETLTQRILLEEHRLYPQAIRQRITSNLKIVGPRVEWTPKKGER